jgi:hypothetical protein
MRRKHDRSDRFFNLRLATAVALLIGAVLIVFVIAHYFAWGTFPG